MTDRRDFLKLSALLAATAPLSAQARGALAADITGAKHALNGDKWKDLRRLFPLDDRYAHFSNFLITSHCKPIADAIDSFRQKLDINPAQVVDYEREEVWQHEDKVRRSAALYLDVKPTQIALTSSTTEGLSMIYGGIHVRPDQEILISEHEHYSARAAIHFRSKRDGTKFRKIRLFENVSQTSTDEILTSIEKNIRSNTRVLGMTWVHSGSGLKLPIGEIGALVDEKNKQRDADNKILFCVDGVHALGVEDFRFPDLKCDFFIAGTHKWLFGPRGTGIICAASEKLENVTPTVASFSREDESFGSVMTPGGYHSFEYRWAAASAFKLHLDLGKSEVQKRIHTLNQYLKQRLQHPRIQLITPLSQQLSAGFTFFRPVNFDEEKLAAYLNANRIIVDAIDRDVGPVVRMAPGLLNNEQEIDRAVALIHQQLG